MLFVNFNQESPNIPIYVWELGYLYINSRLHFMKTQSNTVPIYFFVDMHP